MSDGSSNNVSRFTVLTQSPFLMSFIFLVSILFDNNTSTSPVKHRNPQLELCSFLGGINFPLLSVGVEILRAWLKLLTYVNRFNTCATPTLLLFVVCFTPKSPVANARFNPFSMVVDLIIL